MNIITFETLFKDIGPKQLTKNYDYNAACNDMEQMNLLLKRKVFIINECDGLQIYRSHVHYSYNKFYEHISSNPKVVSKIKKICMSKIQRYMNYLDGYYTEHYGEPFLDCKKSPWYALYTKPMLSQTV